MASVLAERASLGHHSSCNDSVSKQRGETHLYRSLGRSTTEVGEADMQTVIMVAAPSPNPNRSLNAGTAHDICVTALKLETRQLVGSDAMPG